MSAFLWILLLAALAAAGAYVWRSRTGGVPPPSLPTPRGDDLGTLGLSAVRPASTSRSEPVDAAPTSAPERALPRSTAQSPSNVSDVRARPASPSSDAFVRADSPLWAGDAEAIRPLLRSLALLIGGGAAVLRHQDDTYVVDALVGVPGVRTPRPIPADGHPLDRVPQDTLLSLLGPESRRSLSYYADPGAAVGQGVVRALAAPPARRVLLVADVPPGRDELGDDVLRRIGHYGDLLASLTQLDADDDAQAEGIEHDEPADSAADDDRPTAEPSPDEDPAANEPAADELTDDELTDGEPAANELADDVPTVDASDTDAREEDTDADAPDDSSVDATANDARPLPRAVVMQREMDAASDRGRPLAFALVTLMNADSLLSDDPKRVAVAQADLETRLSGAPVSALEPFGDLVLGVFLDAEPDDAVAWAAELAETELPILIGLAPSANEDPEGVRSAATSALEAAYHQGGGLAVAE